LQGGFNHGEINSKNEFQGNRRAAPLCKHPGETAAVPLTEISSYWNQPVNDYLVAINNNFLHLDHLVTGWSWLKLIGKGDFLNFVPVAILSGVTIICYLAIVPGLFKRGDKAYAIMAIAEAAILTLAASGLLAVGH
jgi:hypothetical protein